METRFFEELDIFIENNPHDKCLKEVSNVINAADNNKYDVIKIFNRFRESLEILDGLSSIYTGLRLEQFKYTQTNKHYTKEIDLVNTRKSFLQSLKIHDDGIQITNETLVGISQKLVDQRVERQSAIIRVSYLKRVLELHGVNGMGNNLAWEKEQIRKYSGGTVKTYQQGISNLERYLVKRSMELQAENLESERMFRSRQMSIDIKTNNRRKHEINEVEKKRTYLLDKSKEHKKLMDDHYFGIAPQIDRAIREGVYHSCVCKGLYNIFLEGMKYRYGRDDITNWFDEDIDIDTPQRLSELKIQANYESQYLESVVDSSYTTIVKYDVNLDRALPDGEHHGKVTVDLTKMPSKHKPVIIDFFVGSETVELEYSLCHLNVNMKTSSSMVLPIHPLRLDFDNAKTTGETLVGCGDPFDIKLSVNSSSALPQNAVLAVYCEVLLVV